MESRPFARGAQSPTREGPCRGTDRALAMPGWVGDWAGALTVRRGRPQMTTHSGPCRAYGARSAVIWDLAGVGPASELGTGITHPGTHPLYPPVYPPWYHTPPTVTAMHEYTGPRDPRGMHI